MKIAGADQQPPYTAPPGLFQDFGDNGSPNPLPAPHLLHYQQLNLTLVVPAHDNSANDFRVLVRRVRSQNCVSQHCPARRFTRQRVFQQCDKRFGFGVGGRSKRNNSHCLKQFAEQRERGNTNGFGREQHISQRLGRLLTGPNKLGTGKRESL